MAYHLEIERQPLKEIERLPWQDLERIEAGADERMGLSCTDSHFAL